MTDGQQSPASSKPDHEPAKAPVVDLSRLRLSGVKVLVIEDSRTIRRSAEIMLMQAGCEVVFADDGFDALEKISLYRPDLIFADVLMPRLDGYQTCALIKRCGAHKHIPVIMLTSKDNLFDRARGHAVGANQYLTKPFTKETLLQPVEEHLRGRQAVPQVLHS
jgi:twitching motility two-component system response regulator PilG